MEVRSLDEKPQQFMVVGGKQNEFVDGWMKDEEEGWKLVKV